ncbi:MAG: type II toxin-antitoxin system HicB family antitoxin [Nitrospirae bacterium]|nr:type II toxin-antitoxin system HicB family antitoxin [Nitrospirota bacterium]
MLKYSVSIQWSDSDNGFIAFVPELPGLSAFGNSQEEAVAELHIAADAYIESLRDSEQQLPEPTKVIRYSGQLRLRMPKWLHAKLSRSAEIDNVSLNTYIVTLLSERNGEKEANNLVKELLQNIYRHHALITQVKADTTYLISANQELIRPSLAENSFPIIGGNYN